MSMLPRRAIDPEPQVPIREYLERVLDERDRLYGSRFEASEIAVSAALAAAEKSVNSAFLSQQTAMQAALAAAEKAGAKAELAADKRFEGLNELRGMVTDQQATFMQRGEATALINAINERLIVIQSSYDGKLEGLRIAIEKNADNYTLGQNELRLALTQTLTLSTYELRHTELQRQVNDLRLASSSLITTDTFDARQAEMQAQITSLRESRSAGEGKSSGANALWGVIVGAVGVTAAVVATIIAILKP